MVSATKPKWHGRAHMVAPPSEETRNNEKELRMRIAGIWRRRRMEVDKAEEEEKVDEPEEEEEDKRKDGWQEKKG